MTLEFVYIATVVPHLSKEVLGVYSNKLLAWNAIYKYFLEHAKDDNLDVSEIENNNYKKFLKRTARIKYNFYSFVEAYKLDH